MPEIQIRPAIASDLSTLLAIDHSCQTDYVWQMDVQHEDGQIGAIFREIRLPRSVSVLYPRPVSALSEILESAVRNISGCYWTATCRVYSNK